MKRIIYFILMVLCVNLVNAGVNITDVWINLSNKNTYIPTLEVTNLTVGSNFYYITGYSFDLTTGWNLVPQGENYAKNFTDLNKTLGSNVTFLSYYNTTNRTFKTYYTGFPTINGNFKVPGGYPYYVYSTANTSVNQSFNYTLTNYSIPVGWNVLFNKENNGTSLGEVNNSIGNSSVSLSYFNNTRKWYYSAIPKLSVNKNKVIPYLEPFWAYIQNSTSYER